MKLHILYDNNALRGYRADWGFACLIEGKQDVLFDTGADPSVLEHNMREAGISAEVVDKVVISHDHWDHTGGLPYIMHSNARAHVYILPAFGPTVRSQVQPPALIEVEAPGEISPGIYTTGPVRGALTEQALALETENGIVLVTGCAHPGVDALMQRAAVWGKIYGVLGGFHGFANLDALEGITYLAPCHCSQHSRAIAERFPESYREIMAGTVLEL